eukprot:m.203819 g.203819  ORF g.203819 m.203819 type:complete len:558 (+) comp32864_c1_seq5:236-1909(+)
MPMLVFVCVVLGALVTKSDGCDSSGPDATRFLESTNVRVALYSGELSTCNSTAKCAPFQIVSGADNKNSGIWSGYDVELFDTLATEGNFTYDIISMGSASEISQSVGYTYRARQMLGLETSELDSPADIIGQGTWRVNEDRATWAQWSAPVITEDVWLVTVSAKLIPQTNLEKILLIFSPYEWSVWFILFGTLVMCTVVFSVSAQHWKGTKHEITFCGIFYHMAVNCTGREAIDLNRAHLKGISIGWIFFIFVIAEVYVANLTAILSKPQRFEVGYSSIEEIVDAHASFCVQKNAANDAYFTSNPKWKDRLQYSLTNETRMSSVPEQIDAVVDGRCDSAEVTREDFYAWQKNISNKGDQCIPQLSASRLAKRSRGMMTTANNTCVVFGINTLFAQLGVKRCDSNPEVCDAQDLHLKYFPETTCTDVIQQAFSIEPLDIIDLLGAYIILFTFMLFGAIGTGLSSVNRRCHIPGLNQALGSESATLARNLEKVQAQHESDKYFNLAANNPNERPPKSRLVRLFKRQSADPNLDNSLFKQANVKPAIGKRTAEDTSPYAM